jgi:hypothetical protein
MKISDTVVGVGFVGAGALIVAGTLNYPPLDAGHPGPALFPRILGTLMAALGAALAVQGARARDATQVSGGGCAATSASSTLFVLGSVLGCLDLVEWLGVSLTGTPPLPHDVAPPGAPPGAGGGDRVHHDRALPVREGTRVPLPLGLLWW